MRYLSVMFFLCFWLPLLSSVGVVRCATSDDKLEAPTLLIAVVLRNKAHVLPQFFGYLEQQNYPKSRLSLWIYTDHNVDNTAEIVNSWAEEVSNDYHNVNVTREDGDAFFPDEEGLQKWTPERYWHIIRLREEAIHVARTLWADFVFFLDGDALLSNPKTIQDLVEENRTIIAPMLDSRSAYSNFWCGMNEKGYYKRTDEYMPILEREKVGVFPVVMVHSATLINLNHADSRKLTYDPQKLQGYTGPNDDVITFAHSAKFAGVEMFVSNKDQYGHILAPTESPAQEAEELLNLKLEVTVDGEPLVVSPTLHSFVVPPEKDTLGFDQVYLINLERRPERRKRMEYCFEELGVAFKAMAAVDGNGGLGLESCLKRLVEDVGAHAKEEHCRQWRAQLVPICLYT
ncbi:procollagen galactosyltransferase 1-A-like isoform X3 [Amblyomma americanum]